MTGRYEQAVGAAGPGWVEPPAPGTVIVRCVAPGCRSALVMPPRTPPAVQVLRLEIADWTVGLDGPVCGVDHVIPAAEPEKAASPAVRRAAMVVLYVVVLAVVLGPVWNWDGLHIPSVVNGVVLTVVWWGYLAVRWAMRRNRL